MASKMLPGAGLILLKVCRPWVDVAMNVGSTSDAAGAGGGLAALMVAANPNLTPEQMKAAMIAGTDEVPSMEGQLVSNVRRRLPAVHARLMCMLRYYCPDMKGLLWASVSTDHATARALS